MSFLSDFLKRKTIDTQAQKLAVLFVERLPLARAEDEKRFNAEFEIIFGHLQGFHRKEALGTFGKARLINSFQWALVDKGYETGVAGELGREIASRLTAQRLPRD